MTEVAPLRALLDTAGDIAGRRDTSAAALVATAGEVAGRRDTGAGAKAGRLVRFGRVFKLDL